MDYDRTNDNEAPERIICSKCGQEICPYCEKCQNKKCIKAKCDVTKRCPSTPEYI